MKTANKQQYYSQVPCPECGSNKSERWAYCKFKEQRICLKCEMNCKDYSKTLLANGTNCYRTFKEEPKQVRILTLRFLALPSEVEKARFHYQNMPPDRLYEIFYDLLEKYRASNDTQYRITQRTQLAAIQEILKEAKAVGK